MSIADALIKTIIEMLKECDDLELLYFIQGLLSSSDH